jgi:rubredoxin
MGKSRFGYSYRRNLAVIQYSVFSIKISNLKNTAKQRKINAMEFKTYMCLICGWVYDEAAGLPDEGIAPGTLWKDIPINWTCPECGARKDDFEMMAI